LAQVREFLKVAYPRAVAFLGRSDAERTGLQAAAVVLGVTLAVTLIGWVPLGWLPLTINQFASKLSPRTCGPESRWFIFGPCSALLAIYSLIGSAAVMGILYVYRKALTRALGRLLAKLPGEAEFLSAPVLATVIFTLGWSGVAFHFFDRPGIVIDGLFPPVVGLLTYATTRYDPYVQRSLGPLLAVRDRWSLKVRLGASIAISFVLSLCFTPRLEPPVRDQVLVIIAMIAGYLLLTPPKVGPAAGVRAALGVREESNS
jgi:hypothetical protein